MVQFTSESRILNCLKSKNIENDWRFEDAVGAGVVSKLAAGVIPNQVDLRRDWWRVGNQEFTGSCVGWAAGDSTIRWHFVQAGRLFPNELLSPRYIWMASKETDEFRTRPTTFIEKSGTSLKAALDIARKFGCVRDSVLPFKLGQLYPGKSNTFYAIASQLRIMNYFNLTDPPESRMTRRKNWIAMNGPILTRLNIDSTWDNVSKNNPHLSIYKPNTARGGHAIALVGYTEEYFIVRNSWGSLWGDKGFAYASLQYAEAAFNEAYGIAVEGGSIGYSPVSSSQAMAIQYIVKADDTLTSIARNFGTTINAIVRANDIANPDIIYVGQVLHIPISGDIPDDNVNAKLKISKKGLDFIAQFEGFRGNLYNDPAGHATIGYGHLVHLGQIDGSEPDEFKQGITKKRALELLKEDAASAAKSVKTDVKVALNQQQFDALVSFVFNVGSGNFRGSDLLLRLNQDHYDEVASELKRWVYGGGQVFEGLVRRRDLEADLFDNGVYGKF
jgi:GH24 family phage-related lysozyme (muramidase)